MGHLTANFSELASAVVYASRLNCMSKSRVFARSGSTNVDKLAAIRMVVITVISLVWFVLPSSSKLLLAQQSIATESIGLKTGRALHRCLNSPVTVSLTEAPFADRIRAFAATRQFAVFIDRRINPDARLNLRRTDVTIEQILLDAADDLGIGMCQVGDLIYFGPMTTAVALPTLWQSLPEMNSSPARTLAWQHLSRPRDILKTIAEKGRFELIGLEKIHHDLWVEYSLPALSPVQQVAIVSVGFEQWPKPGKINRSRIALDEIKFPKAGTLNHRRSPFDSRSKSELKSELADQFPDIKFRINNEFVRMSGRHEQLYAARAFLIRSNQPDSSDDQDTRFSMKTAATRLQLLKAIAKQTGRKLVYDELNDRAMDQITIECREVTLETLVQMTLDGSNITFEITDSEIKLSIEGLTSRN
jgi:hypothetical protein